MVRVIAWWIALCSLVTATASATSGSTLEATDRARAARDGDETRVGARLLVDRIGERRARVGVLFELDPGWHLYWRNPGDTGLAPRLEWNAGLGTVGPVAWPAPQIFSEEAGLTTYGYEGRVLLASDAFWDEGVALPSRVSVEADVLVCAELCIPGSLTLARRLTEADAHHPETRAVFERWARRVPMAAEDAGVDARASLTQSAVRPGDNVGITLEVDPCGVREADCRFRAPDPSTAVFFPYALPGIDVRPAGALSPREGRAFSVAFRAIADADAGSEGPDRLRGIVALRDADGGTRPVEIEVPFPRAPRGAEVSVLRPPAQPGPASDAGIGLLNATLLGFLGGLLLNLMPCVLPVLALKVFALADLASRDRREVAAHVIGYAAGILSAMGALAICVVGLRAAGAGVGWGFHLQEPVFVLGVCALLVAFAANLFGAFEIEVDTSRLAQVGAERSGAVRSFFDGLLAVILATPCSAPFLGTAVGFAFASSAPVVAAIFLSIGLGLAAPFAVAAAAPSLSRRMPRSGAWMLHVRAGLGFALLATVVWLLWVLGRSAGPDAMAGALAVLLLVGLVAWGFGLLQRSGRPLPMPALAAAIVAVGIAGVDFVDLSTPPANRQSVARGPTPWAEDAVAAALEQGRAAFVYFTADWCITCKFNERRVLADSRVRDAYAAHDIAVFRADWTRRDETIRSALARLGKAGVPVYAVYTPKTPDRPELLPEILSVDQLVGALDRAAASALRAGVKPASSVNEAVAASGS